MNRNFNTSPQNSSFEDPNFDTQTVKSKLFAQLDSMKKAIDGYKEQKEQQAVRVELVSTPKSSYQPPPKDDQHQNNISIVDLQNQEQQSFLLSKSSSIMDISQTTQQNLSRNNSNFTYPHSCRAQTNQPLHFNNFHLQHDDTHLLGKTITLQSQEDDCSTVGEGAQTGAFKLYLDQLSPRFEYGRQEREIQCEIEYQAQSEFISKHKEQLQMFESQLNILKQQLAFQQDNEANLRQKMDHMSYEIHTLHQDKQACQQREEHLLKQTEDLVQVVEDQIQELQVRDKQIQDLNEFELKCYELQQVLHNRQQDEQQLKIRIEELQEMVAEEVNKKRLMKQEYDDQMIELNDKIDYYREKYDGMKDLLASCKEQLREFEELNLMRNEVIEKLEVENLQLKNMLKSSVNNYTTASTMNSVRNNGEMSLLQQTPGKYVDKSFSLNLQQVNCDQSSSRLLVQEEYSRVNQSINEGRQRCESKQNNYMSERKGQLNSRLNIHLYENHAQQQKRQGVMSEIVTPKSQMEMDNNHSHQSYIQMSSKRRNQLDYEREHDAERSQLLPQSNNESMIISQPQGRSEMQRQESATSLKSINSPTVSNYEHKYQMKQKLKDFCLSPQQENPYKLSFGDVHQQSDEFQDTTYSRATMNQYYTPQQYEQASSRQHSEQKQHYHQVSHQPSSSMYSEQSTPRVFRVMSNQINEYQEMRQQNKKQPFDYHTASSSAASTQLVHQESIDKRSISQKPNKNNQQPSYTFAHQPLNESYVMNQSFHQDNNQSKLSSSSLKAQQEPPQKLSIKEEIKKLHNNINNLRQKMNIHTKPGKMHNQENDVSMSEDRKHGNTPQQY